MALLLTLAAGLASCGENDTAPSASASSSASADPTRAVRATAVTRGLLEATRSASVTVRPSQESRVAAGANGRVMEILVREGGQLAAGDPLMRLDDSQARVAVDNAELALAQARINADRARRASDDAAEQAAAALRTAEQNVALLDRQVEEARALFNLGALAASDLDGLIAQRSQAESGLLQAREAVGRSGRAESEDLALLDLQVQQAEVGLRQAREALFETIVRAPFVAEVAELFVEVGEFVGAGSPVARLLGVGAQIGAFTVSPEDASALEAQGTLTFLYLGTELQARIVRLERNAQQARLVSVIAELDPAAPRLPAGALAEVRYTITLAEGLQVASGALFADAGRNYVFVVDDAGVARRREVRVVAETGNAAIVEHVTGTEQGRLEVGTLVISPRPLDVRDGTLVRVVGE
jgi:HlyD family secretion protein